MALQEQDIKILYGCSCVANTEGKETAYSGYGEVANELLEAARVDLFQQLNKEFSSPDHYGKSIRIKVSAVVSEI